MGGDWGQVSESDCRRGALWERARASDLGDGQVDLCHGASEHAGAPEGPHSWPVEQKGLLGSEMFVPLTGRPSPRAKPGDFSEKGQC